MEDHIRTATTDPLDAAALALPATDAQLVAGLHNHRLRALLIIAARLSIQNQLRLEAVAQTLGEAEGSHQLGHTQR